MSSGKVLMARTEIFRASVQRLLNHGWFCLVAASLIVSVPLAQAAQYDAEGYIVTTSMKGNGERCLLTVAGDEEGSGSHVGSWDCHGEIGKNMLALADLAKEIKNPVRITFSDSALIPSPVLSIELLK
ncbi:hypothetical protein R84981_002117 [Carnimonas sp. R-84981]|uniref:hypothetical protein n=1 Tax=Carnimonas bestiolae TaxID=3402172 RepID=UPI003EDC1CCC